MKPKTARYGHIKPYTGHDAMITVPNELSELFLKLAK